MKSDFDEIIDKFFYINGLSYVKGINNNSTNSCGLTFEQLLNKKADSNYFPDFNGIEIKTTQRFSRYSIGLFSLSFDGPDIYESNYVLQKYGKENIIFENKKELFVNCKIKEKVLVNNNYYFELNIDYVNKKLLIDIFDLDYNYIESRCFLSFSNIEKRINTKLQKLALIFASKKIEQKWFYFRYYKIECYIMKDFNTFLKLIETGDIEIHLMLRFAKNGKDIGKNKNKNFVFRIKKDSMNKLFDEIYSFEN